MPKNENDEDSGDNGIETDTDKDWTGSDKVWVVHKSGFSSGAVSKSLENDLEEKEKANEESADGVDVKLDHGGHVIKKIDGSSVEKVCMILLVHACKLLRRFTACPKNVKIYHKLSTPQTPFCYI